MTYISESTHVEGWGDHIYKDGELIAVVFDSRYTNAIDEAIDEEEVVE